MNQLTPTGICGSADPADEPTPEEHTHEQVMVYPFIGGHYLPSTGQDPDALYFNLIQLSHQTGPFAAFRHHVVDSVYACCAYTSLAGVPTAFTEAPTPQQMVVWLLNNSGLTGDQLSRILGVSRRAVYTWVDGRRVNGTNLERLANVYQSINQIPAATPGQRRNALFAPRGRQRNLFDELAANARKALPPRTTVPVAERLGAAD